MTQEIIEKPMSAECTMKQYEAIPDADFVENREYQLIDYPDNGANAEQMAYALTCKRLFPAGTVITFSGATDDNYTNGHLYQIQLDTNGTKSWKDITPAGNALTKPTTTPSTTQIVAVDNTNTQTMLNIGDGLSVENGSLKASGGTGGKLYYKSIQLQILSYSESLEGTMSINIYFYESNNTLYNIENIDTLYQKIPFAICNNESDPQLPDSPVWIFGCKISATNFTFYCLTKDGHFKVVPVLFENINNSDIMITCNNIEV